MEESPKRVRRTRESIFTSALNHPIAVAMSLGVIPLKTAHTGEKVFTSNSFVSYRCYALLIGLSIIEFVALTDTFKHLNSKDLKAHGGFKKITGASIFYGTCLSHAILLFIVGVKWTEISNLWNKLEKEVVNYGPVYLKKKFTLITIVMLFFALAEHFYHNWLSTNYYLLNWPNKDIVQETGINSTDGIGGKIQVYIKMFSLQTHGFLISEHSYTLWKGISIVCLSFQATFIWNFVDLLLVLICTGLMAQLKAFNDYLLYNINKDISHEEWKRHRKAYFSITDLTKKVDSKFNKLMLVSIGSDTYFVCAQIMEGIDTSQVQREKVFFFMFSMSVLALRLVSVVMSASNVHTENLRTTEILFSVPSECYNVEIKRWMQQSRNEFIGMTGFNLFPITRKFLLAVASAVLTYEVILINLRFGTS